MPESLEAKPESAFGLRAGRLGCREAWRPGSDIVEQYIKLLHREPTERVFLNPLRCALCLPASPPSRTMIIQCQEIFLNTDIVTYF